MQGTIFSLLPPICAIVLALITKEVYISLFSGIVVGALLYSNFNILGTIDNIFSVMSESIYGNGTNVQIILFLVIFFLSLFSVFLPSFIKYIIKELYAFLFFL